MRTRAGSDSGFKVEPPAIDGLSFSTAADGTRFLLLTVGSDAPVVRIRFTKFRVPLDAAVFVYGVNPNGTVTNVHGPYSGAGPADLHEFWSGPVSGTAVVEYQAGALALPDLPFEIDEIEPAKLSTDTRANLPEKRDVELRTAWFRDRNIVYEVRNGIGIFEGDIELGPVELLEPAKAEAKGGRRDGMGLSSTRYRWPGGVMPYVIDPAITYTQVVLDAVAHWNNRLVGVIRIVPHTTEANYVQFRHNTTPVCSSYVGMVGLGMQSINLSEACSFGATVHEIGHALGLFHEQTREDRDNHIRVLFENMNSAYAHNFSQSNADADDIGAYDYGSIMHYNAYAFSSNGLPTIETIPAGIPIGQRSGLSSGDIDAVKALYGSVTPAPAPLLSVTITTNPAGLQLTIDGTAVSTPYTAQWIAGSQHTVSAPSLLFANGVRHEFHRWSDDGAQTHTITAPSQISQLTADYTVSHRVTTSVNGLGSVRMSPVSASGYYPDNSVVVLTATPAAGSCFTGWTGFLGGTLDTVTLTVTKEYAVAANFAADAASAGRSAEWFPRAGGEVEIPVSAPAGCAWTAASEASWIRIIGPASGTGHGAVRIAADANNTGKLRMGRVTVKTAAYLVVQSGF